ncbi:MAG: rod shape-determining protein RodA [Bacteroidetes bacterium GWA2_30_7]|nr:MAG: rod shape-determining protein RodA [Bacteroidetes bacterium GWA2_30_7]
MKRKVNLWFNIDWLTILLYVLLIIMGWINIYAAVYNEEHHSIFDVTQRYGKQLIWIGAAVVLIFIILLIDSEFYVFFAYIIYGFFLILLISVLVFGKEVNGARSWFEIGSIRIQPAEFAKFATNLVVAKYISSFNIKIQKFQTLFIVGIFLFIPAILILMQNDTGSALVYVAFIFVLYREGLSGGFLILGLLMIILFIVTLIVSKLSILITLMIICLVIFFFMRQKINELLISTGIYLGVSGLIFAIITILRYNVDIYYVLSGGLIASSIYYAIYCFRKRMSNVLIMIMLMIASVSFTFVIDYVYDNVLEVHQRDRINELLGLQSDPLGAGYNVNQSKIAIGSGGFFGKGFLQGTQTKYDFVPEQSTDFIFCTIGEEWGFLGSLVVILLHTFLLLRLIMLAERQKSPFTRIYGYGVASILFFHVAINIGMTIGLAPVIGIPLPFFSYGGSSLWSFTILLFVFLKLDVSRLEKLV